MEAWQKPYHHCRVCERQLAPELVSRAMKEFERKTCSPECSKKDAVRAFGCCEKAAPYACVCAYSFTCPDHGTTHVGSHD